MAFREAPDKCEREPVEPEPTAGPVRPALRQSRSRATRLAVDRLPPKVSAQFNINILASALTDTLGVVLTTELWGNTVMVWLGTVSL